MNEKKEKVLLIIGNGFDLFHGLPTSFKDFFILVENFSIIEECYLKAKNNKKKLCFNRKRIAFDNSIDRVEAFLDFVKKGEFTIRFYEKFKNIVQKNKNRFANKLLEYFRFLKAKSKKSDINWCDFEMIIDDALHIIQDAFKCGFRNDLMRRNADNDRMYLEKYNKIYDLYIKKVIENGNNSLKDREQMVINNMLKDFKFFKIAFDIYINEFVNQMKVDVFSIELDEWYKKGDIDYLSFNYLDYHNYSNLIKEEKKVTFIHGYTHEVGDNYESIDKYYKNSIVIGIPDDSFNDAKYIEFQKFFQRIMNKTKGITIESIEEYSSLIIFGHSLHKLDETVLKIIFDAASPQRHLYIYCHNQEDMKNKLMRVLSWYNKETLIEKISNNSISFNILSKPVKYGTSYEEIVRIKNENAYKQSLDMIE